MRTFFFCALLVLSFFAQSQKSDNNLFSTIGIGEYYSGEYSYALMMGGTGVSYSNGLTVNGLNPSLLARTKFTNFEVGFQTRYSHYENTTETQKIWGGNVKYVALNLPISKKWTTAFSYQPYTTVDYNVSNSNFLMKDTVLYGLQGTGGLNRFSWKNGISIGSYSKTALEIGVDISYIFGSTETFATSQFNNQNYSTQSKISVAAQGFSVTLGGSLRTKINKKMFLNIGGTITPSVRIGADRMRILDVIFYNGIGTGYADTLESSKGNVTLPLHYRGGLALEIPYKWVFSFDYSVDDWKLFRNYESSTSNLTNGITFAVGSSFIPNSTSISNYWNRVSYSIGYQYQKKPYSINGQTISENRLSVGFGLPIWNSSTINLGFSLGERGQISIIKERFFQFNVSFSLMDRWFQRRVID